MILNMFKIAKYQVITYVSSFSRYLSLDFEQRSKELKLSKMYRLFYKLANLELIFII
jgi:hypothetical protein